MRTLAKDSACQGDKLTLVDFEGRWGFVPASEIWHLPKNGLWSRLWFYWIFVLNILFGEAKTEIEVPELTRLQIAIPTVAVERALGAVGKIEVLYHKDGLQVGDRVVPFAEFGELLGAEVIRIPLVLAVH